MAGTTAGEDAMMSQAHRWRHARPPVGAGRLAPFVLACVLVVPCGAGAQHAGGHAHGAPPAAAQNGPASARGEVRGIDRPAGKITLRHEAMPALGMTPMTMPFPVASPALLDGVAVGDRVVFTAERVGGEITVTKIGPAPR